jgi:hypothetical protein
MNCMNVLMRATRRRSGCVRSQRGVSSAAIGAARRTREARSEQSARQRVGGGDPNDPGQARVEPGQLPLCRIDIERAGTAREGTRPLYLEEDPQVAG